MDIKKRLQDIYKFLTVGIWSVGKDDVPSMRFLFYSILKKLLLAIEFTTTKRITSAAAALTYSTLLAIVPIFAVVFGIARGFGFNKYIELWFRESFSSQPQVAEIIIGFVNSYLVHTKSGLFCNGLSTHDFHLAGEEAAQRVPHHHRLHVDASACADSDSYHVGYKHLLRHYLQGD